MKTIEVDEELYRYIASQTCRIGESASDILRRLLDIDGHAAVKTSTSPAQKAPQPTSTVPASQSPMSNDLSAKVGIVVGKEAGQVDQQYTVKALRSLLISDEFAALTKVIDRFMLVLSTLYQLDPEGFSDAMSVKGRKRVYFASDEQTLLENGKTTKPKAIPNTPFWVITNNNTSRKQQMLEQVMARMALPADVIQRVMLSL